MEVSSDAGFWEFHKTGVDGGPFVPCRNLEEQSTEGAEGARSVRRWQKTETTNLSVMGK